MKVKVKFPYGDKPTGSIVDIKDERAKRLIANGDAEEVKAKGKDK